ncbi:MAG: hypothetical protein HRU19_05910 [Pseudobacteriovorax sp.]|nr:hypothetical protein [Pseudobacteriovorax sp.]
MFSNNQRLKQSTKFAAVALSLCLLGTACDDDDKKSDEPAPAKTYFDLGELVCVQLTETAFKLMPADQQQQLEEGTCPDTNEAEEPKLAACNAEFQTWVYYALPGAEQLEQACKEDLEGTWELFEQPDPADDIDPTADPADDDQDLGFTGDLTESFCYVTFAEDREEIGATFVTGEKYLYEPSLLSGAYVIYQDDEGYDSFRIGRDEAGAEFSCDESEDAAIELAIADFTGFDSVGNEICQIKKGTLIDTTELSCIGNSCNYTSEGLTELCGQNTVYTQGEYIFKLQKAAE